jgi:acyl carrier protein
MAAMHSPDQIRQSLHDFLEESFLGMRPGLVLEGDTQLLADGIVDSMGVLELLSFVEGTFGVSVADDEVVDTNLGSLDALVRFISRKQGSSAVAEAR